MKEKISQNRLVIYLMLFGLIPFFLVVFSYLSDRSELDALEQQLDATHYSLLSQQQKQSLNNRVRAHFRDADHFYIDKHLETLTFLESEIEALQQIVSHNAVAGNPRVEERLEFLLSPANCLAFTESAVLSYDNFQEMIETAIHTVEVNTEDLQKILSRIEGTKIGPYTAPTGKPQLIITDFRLERKKTLNQNEVFLLYVKLLKREFI
jgi:hypothetical protein